MLRYITVNGEDVRIEGRAHVVLALDDAGVVWLQAFVDGHSDSSFFTMPDAKLLGVAVPGVLAELRQQIQVSAVSGSTVTE